MKKNYGLAFIGTCILLLSGCGSQASQMNYIGASQAKETALAEAGLSETAVESISTDMDTENGLDYYEVTFEAEGRKYEYDIDALTGAVIASHEDSRDNKALPQTAANEQQADDQTKAANTTAPASPAAQAKAEAPAAPLTNTDGVISKEDANAAALAHAGLSSGQVTFIKSKLEYDDGRQVYDVEFYTNDYKEYDYEIDALSGEVISYDYDAEDYAPPASAGADGAALTAEEAKALALSQVPGAADSDIREFETDYDDGRMEYEGKIIYDGMEYEFEIDAYSGAFRSWESEPWGR